MVRSLLAINIYRYAVSQVDVGRGLQEWSRTRPEAVESSEDNPSGAGQYPDGGIQVRRFMFFLAGLFLLFCAWAFAAEQKATPAPAKAVSGKTTAVTITKMRAPGTILEITDSTLIIERKVKDNVETMEFILEKPMKYKAGDKVRVTYLEDKGKKIVTRIVKLSDLKEKKPVVPGKETKPAAGSAIPAHAAPAAK
jgi:hypothetical protein